MTSTTIWAFWGVSILFVMMPGVDWAYSIAAGTRSNKVVPAVSGLLVGHSLVLLMVAAGIGTLINSHPQWIRVLTIVGALYIAWTGFRLYCQPLITSQTAPSLHAVEPTSWFAKGICISALNPKVTLLLVAMLPPFVDTHVLPSPMWQILCLGGIHLANSAVVYFLVGLAAKKMLHSRPRAAYIVNRTSGILLMLIGVLLITELSI